MILNCIDLGIKWSNYSIFYVNGMIFFYILIIVIFLIVYGIVIVIVCVNWCLRMMCNYFIVSFGIVDLMIVFMVILIGIGLI